VVKIENTVLSLCTLMIIISLDLWHSCLEL
jgi:hypothetical protein